MDEMVTDALDQARYELAVANRIVAREGVFDAFGHLSIRHPTDPTRFMMSRSRSPELVEPSDILEYTFDSLPVQPSTVPMYGERVIHGCIYQARPDVHAVVHHHSGTMMPFCITDDELFPVSQLGATIGVKVPVWDSRDEFGDTNLLVVKPEEGQSLARALGPHWVVLLRRHGVVVVANNLRAVVFRTIWSAKNAEYQLQAKSAGKVDRLSMGEIEAVLAHQMKPSPLGRAWEYWVKRLEKAGELPDRKFNLPSQTDK